MRSWLSAGAGALWDSALGAGGSVFGKVAGSLPGAYAASRIIGSVLVFAAGCVSAGDCGEMMVA